MLELGQQRQGEQQQQELELKPLELGLQEKEALWGMDYWAVGWSTLMGVLYGVKEEQVLCGGGGAVGRGWGRSGGVVAGAAVAGAGRCPKR